MLFYLNFSHLRNAPFSLSQIQSAIANLCRGMFLLSIFSFYPNYQCIRLTWTSVIVFFTILPQYLFPCHFILIILVQNGFHHPITNLFQKYWWGLPLWRSGWESACQCRAPGFKPWSGKIPRAAEQLGPWATITEPAHLEPVLSIKRGRDSERPAHLNEEWPPLAATGESPLTEMKTQHNHK